MDDVNLICALTIVINQTKQICSAPKDKLQSRNGNDLNNWQCTYCISSLWDHTSNQVDKDSPYHLRTSGHSQLLYIGNNHLQCKSDLYWGLGLNKVEVTYCTLLSESFFLFIYESNTGSNLYQSPSHLRLIACIQFSKSSTPANNRML